MLKDLIFIKYRHFWFLCIFGLVGISFGLCEKLLTPEIVIYSRLDSYIPFIKEAVIPYLLWYVYIAGAILYLGFTSKPDYYRLVAFLISGLCIAVIIYILFPNEQRLRPVILESDAFSMIMRFIYTVDTPTNVMPSVHVINCVAVHVSLVNCVSLKDNRLIKAISFLCMVSISLSTVFVKQHSIIDVFGGVIVGIVIYMLIYKLPVPVFLRKYVESQ